MLTEEDEKGADEDTLKRVQDTIVALSNNMAMVNLKCNMPKKAIMCATFMLRYPGIPPNTFLFISGVRNPPV